MRQVSFVVVLAATTTLIACTFLPLLSTKWWLTDVGLAAVASALAVNVAILWPYREGGGNDVEAYPADRRLSVLIANVQFGNRNAAGLLDAFRRADPDLFLAMKTGAWWDESLTPFRERMPNVLKRIKGHPTP